MIRGLMVATAILTVFAGLLVGGGWAVAAPVVIFGPLSLPTVIILLVGIVLGGLWVATFGRYAGMTISADQARRMAHAATVPLVAMVAGLLCIVAIERGPIPPIDCGIAYILSMIALIAGLRCNDALGRGESLGVESHWGGLGGNSGGWRLLPATALALLSLSFAGGAITVALGGQRAAVADTKKQDTTPAATNVSGDNRAAGSSGAGLPPANTHAENSHAGSAR